MTDPQKPNLPPERRAALFAHLRLRQQTLKRADLDLKRQVAKAAEEGMSLVEIANVLGLESPGVAGRLRNEGKRAGG
ncbi:hypothetical protein [Actinacidiphila glaucinigra]|uniref:hypothetical protein n=1 Tax=Actinacidiphila glaucinigra TaxID=235986 RepID=UPI0035DCEB3E